MRQDNPIKVYVAGCWHVGDASSVKAAVRESFPECSISAPTEYGASGQSGYGFETPEFLRKMDIVLYSPCECRASYDAVEEYKRQGGLAMSIDVIDGLSKEGRGLNDAEIQNIEYLIRTAQRYK